MNSKINLTFTLPDSKETINVEGIVMWVQQKSIIKESVSGMGVQFVEFPNEDKLTLKKFVERYSNEPTKKSA